MPVPFLISGGFYFGKLKKDLLNIYVLPFGMHSYIIGEESTLLCVAEMSIIVYYTI